METQTLFLDAKTQASLAEFNKKLNEAPPAELVNEYNKSSYLAIGIVESMLFEYFMGTHQIEITKHELTSLNNYMGTVVLSVRIHYIHPILGIQMHQDGIGAQTLTYVSKMPRTPDNLTYDTIALSFPNAYSEAIKNACKRIGRVFGRDLGRKDDKVMDNTTFNEKMNVVIEVANAESLEQKINGVKSIKELTLLDKELIRSNRKTAEIKNLIVAKAVELKKGK